MRSPDCGAWRGAQARLADRLDPALEVDASRDLPDDLAAFVRAQWAVLAALGVRGDRAAELIAHAATECGRGRRAHAHNLGGIKLREAENTEHKAKHGRGLAWWRDLGHVDAGDDDVVYYRGFDDDADFWRYLLKTRVGTPGAAPTKERYAEASRVFWSADPSGWMLALLLAGYRGDTRRREAEAQGDAHPSAVAHRNLVARVRGMLA